MSPDRAFDPRRPPIRAFWGDSPIPDLSKIPREHWVAVLAHADPQTHRYAAYGLPDDLKREASMAAAASLSHGPKPPDRGPVLTAAAWPDAIPDVPAHPVPVGPARQVNFRLSAADFERLERGAKLLGLRPTAAARLLVLRAVQQVLREAGEPHE